MLAAHLPGKNAKGMEGPTPIRHPSVGVVHPEPARVIPLPPFSRSLDPAGSPLPIEAVRNRGSVHYAGEDMGNHRLKRLC